MKRWLGRVEKQKNLFPELIEITAMLRGELYMWWIYDTKIVDQLMESVLDRVKSDEQWFIEVTKADAQLKRMATEFREELYVGGVNMILEEQLYSKLLKDLKTALPIETDKLVQVVSPNHSEIADLKDQVTKGNRANFKMLQEVIEEITKISEGLPNSEGHPYIQDEAESLKKLTESYTQTLMSMFDLIDLIRDAVEQHGDKSWKESVDTAIANAKVLLENHGIEEISVEGLLFDGKIMEGIGTISPQEEWSRELPKYAVYAVAQRGFRYNDNQQLIRRAKVITVY